MNMTIDDEEVKYRDVVWVSKHAFSSEHEKILDKAFGEWWNMSDWIEREVTAEELGDFAEKHKCKTFVVDLPDYLIAKLLKHNCRVYRIIKENGKPIGLEKVIKVEIIGERIV